MALEPPQPIHLALDPLVSETVELTHGLSHARPCPGFREAIGYDRYAKPSKGMDRACARVRVSSRRPMAAAMATGKRQRKKQRR